MSDSTKLVVGTAGHIDHGKSSLVHALTGENPDRLPEEQARGMTIDLGFAHARIEQADVWFVDVPGHERFIRNMVAGATGVDVALLVVAGDDSVMPQTREHAELLSLLGVDRCVLVITKIDLIDQDWADAVELEARDLLRSVGVEPIAAVRVSSLTGQGLESLRTVLARMARERAARADGYAWFRLPIDRVFSIPGRGLVVTGSVAHGALQRDEVLELWPGPRRVRARELHTHHEAAVSAIGRMRLAVNLAGVELGEVSRGCELATPAALETTTRMDVWLASLRLPGKLRRRTVRARLHLATSEALAELRLLDPLEESGRSTFAQVRLAQPLVAEWGQRFIVRDESGQRTLGGGRVLRPVAPPWSTKRAQMREELLELRDAPPKRRLCVALRDLEWTMIGDGALATRAGVADAGAMAALRKELAAEGRVVTLADGLTVGREVVESLGESLQKRLETQQAANSRWPGVPLAEWANWMPRACPERLRGRVGEWMLARGRFCSTNGFITGVAANDDLPEGDRTLLEAVLTEFRAAAFQPPDVDQLKAATPKNQKRVRELVALAVARGRLLRVGADILIHHDVWADGVAALLRAIRERGPLAVSDIRGLLNSSRKYVVPILERLDALGVTKRLGDLRSAGAAAPPVERPSA